MFGSKSSEIARLRSEKADLAERIGTAEKLAEERLCTIVRLCAEVDQLRDGTPDGPVQAPRPLRGDVEVRRQLHVARGALASLDERCRELQDANVGLTRELHDLRQGGES